MREINIEYKNNYMHEAKIGNKTIVMDEPTEAGGDDLGPTPVEMMVAALGACTSMTIMMYARRKGWQIDDIKIKLNLDKIQASECETCETKVGKINKITRQITIKGLLDEDQQKRLIEIAQKCPVHEALKHENLVIDEIIMN